MSYGTLKNLLVSFGCIQTVCKGNWKVDKKYFFKNEFQLIDEEAVIQWEITIL